MRTHKERRDSNAINAGSMADIAFLLLIFFLVTTTIIEDKGILVKLPRWEEEKVIVQPVPDRNLLSVKIRSDNAIMIENEPKTVDEIKALAKEFIQNPLDLPTLPKRPKNAVISLQHDRGTEYDIYLSVYNELKAAYRELWEEKALQRYRKSYDNLTMAEQKAIRSEIPLVISEAEPTEF